MTLTEDENLLYGPDDEDPGERTESRAIYRKRRLAGKKVMEFMKRYPVNSVTMIHKDPVTDKWEILISEKMKIVDDKEFEMSYTLLKWILLRKLIYYGKALKRLEKDYPNGDESDSDSDSD